MSTTLKEANKIINDPSLAEEELLDSLENDDDFSIPAHIRDQRLAELKRQTAEFATLGDRGHGRYTDMPDEKVFLGMTTVEERAVVHFYHKDFKRCDIMDGHLEKIANTHFTTKFAKIDVNVAKFFVVKLKIQVLPCVLCFRKGQIVDRISGFEEIGNKDNFKTEQLEKRLVKSGMIELSKPGSYKQSSSQSNSIFSRSSKYNRDDESDDSD